MQLTPNLAMYVALRLLNVKTDFDVVLYCDNEEFTENGFFNYSKWAYNQFGDWETRIKYVIKW